jgi:hypothetical protein
MEFPRDSFFAKDGSEANDFIAFPEVSQFIKPEGDLFNDANTWMTSSTLSTKFTNHEMNVAKLGRAQGGRAVESFPPFDPEHDQDGFWPHNDQRPDEVFVKTPQPQHDFNGNMFSSFSDFVAAKPESQLFQSASNANVTEAFDPFARETTPQKPPAVRRVVLSDGFQLPSRLQGYSYEPSQVFITPINETEVFDPFAMALTLQEPPVIERYEIHEGCFPISSLPQENNYVSIKTNLRSASRNADREGLS